MSEGSLTFGRNGTRIGIWSRKMDTVFRKIVWWKANSKWLHKDAQVCRIVSDIKADLPSSPQAELV